MTCSQRSHSASQLAPGTAVLRHTVASTELLILDDFVLAQSSWEALSNMMTAKGHLDREITSMVQMISYLKAVITS